MPKLTLDLDDLEVESYSTGSAQPVPERMGPTTTRTQEPTCTCQTFCPEPC